MHRARNELLERSVTAPTTFDRSHSRLSNVSTESVESMESSVSEQASIDRLARDWGFFTSTPPPGHLAGSSSSDHLHASTDSINLDILHRSPVPLLSGGSSSQNGSSPETILPALPGARRKLPKLKDAPLPKVLAGAAGGAGAAGAASGSPFGDSPPSRRQLESDSYDEVSTTVGFRPLAASGSGSSGSSSSLHHSASFDDVASAGGGSVREPGYLSDDEFGPFGGTLPPSAIAAASGAGPGAGAGASRPATTGVISSPQLQPGRSSRGPGPGSARHRGGASAAVASDPRGFQPIDPDAAAAAASTSRPATVPAGMLAGGAGTSQGQGGPVQPIAVRPSSRQLAAAEDLNGPTTTSAAAAVAGGAATLAGARPASRGSQQQQQQQQQGAAAAALPKYGSRVAPSGGSSSSGGSAGPTSGVETFASFAPLPQRMSSLTGGGGSAAAAGGSEGGSLRMSPEFLRSGGKARIEPLPRGSPVLSDAQMAAAHAAAGMGSPASAEELGSTSGKRGTPKPGGASGAPGSGKKKGLTHYRSKSAHVPRAAAEDRSDHADPDADADDTESQPLSGSGTGASGQRTERSHYRKSSQDGQESKLRRTKSAAPNRKLASLARPPTRQRPPPQALHLDHRDVLGSRPRFGGGGFDAFAAPSSASSGLGLTSPPGGSAGAGSPTNSGRGSRGARDSPTTQVAGARNSPEGTSAGHAAGRSSRQPSAKQGKQQQRAPQAPAGSASSSSTPSPGSARRRITKPSVASAASAASASGSGSASGAGSRPTTAGKGGRGGDRDSFASDAGGGLDFAAASVSGTGSLRGVRRSAAPVAEPVGAGAVARLSAGGSSARAITPASAARSSMQAAKEQQALLAQLSGVSAAGRPFTVSHPLPSSASPW